MLAPSPDARPSLDRVTSTDAFDVAIDPARRHLLLVSRGLWDDRVIAAFAPALATGIERLVRAGVRFGTLRTMIDVRDAAIIPQLLVGALQSLAEKHGPASERVAFLCSSVLQKMQYQRIAPQEVFGHFTDETAALAWLTTEMADA